SGQILPELKSRPQWVCWRYERRRDAQGRPKWTKIPIDPKTGRNAESNDPGTWGTWEQAWQYHREHPNKTAGVGFVFRADDPYTGVDLDDAINLESGEVAPWARLHIDGLNTYTEISPSGTGVKLIVRAVKPGERCRRGNVEMYDR